MSFEEAQAQTQTLLLELGFLTPNLWLCTLNPKGSDLLPGKSSSEVKLLVDSGLGIWL